LYTKIKKLYYRKIKYAHVYAEQSRRIKNSEISAALWDFSNSEYNQAVEFKDMLEEKGIKTNNLLRILVEINSVYVAMFSMRLGAGVMLKYNKHLEKRAIYHMKKLKDLPTGINVLVEKFIKEDEEHKKYFSQ
jgi:hypothetical protein